MPKPRPRIGVDLDGCLYEWDKTARYMLRNIRKVSSAYHNRLKKESIHWDYIQSNCSKQDWDWLWKEGVELGLFRYGHLVTGAIEALRELSEVADLVVITHRPKSVTQDTLDWLSFNKLPFSEVHMLSNKENKNSVACDFYIDDSLAVMNQLVHGRTAFDREYKIILMDRAWNSGAMLREADLRATSWPQIVKYVKEELSADWWLTHV